MSFHLGDDIFFRREEDGSVTCYHQPPESEEKILFKTAAGGWSSIVLSMSAYGERPCDWFVFMDYHMGKKDIITPHKEE